MAARALGVERRRVGMRCVARESCFWQHSQAHSRPLEGAHLVAQGLGASTGSKMGRDDSEACMGERCFLVAAFSWRPCVKENVCCAKIFGSTVISIIPPD